MAAGHASPVLFDIFAADDDSLATADHASPVLCDAANQVRPDQLQYSHHSKDASIQASPVLFDVGCQTEISILKSWPN
eukprot:7665176-Karenia_brevis.AAC.1